MYLYVAFRFNVNDNLLLCLKQVCSLKYKTINTVVLHIFNLDTNSKGSRAEFVCFAG